VIGLNASWGCPPFNPILAADDVHVWFFDLDRLAVCVGRLWALLSDDERARAQRFHFERDQRRFAVGRGILREILGLYLDWDPGRLIFAYGPRGKPMLGMGCGDGTLRFNLSHSQGVGLIAVARNREVGVDIEHVRPMPGIETMASRSFSRQESAALLGMSPERRQRGFFSCWTRKEAYLKAVGDGLAISLDAFAVSIDPDEPARLLWVAGEPNRPSDWTLVSVTPRVNAIGAVAFAGRTARVACFEWLAGSRGPEA